MEPIRYKPGEAIRWLKLGAETIRKNANVKGKEVIHSGKPTDLRDVGHKVATAAGAIADLGKSAMADLKHDEFEATEYVLLDSGFDLVKGPTIKSIGYDRVKRIEQRGDRLVMHLEKGNVVIKPHAYLVAGSIKVPVGWRRNGMEVPYELLAEELAARCGVNIEGK
jgi:hypothetical protein